jgi:hypothetical protein
MKFAITRSFLADITYPGSSSLQFLFFPSVNKHILTIYSSELLTMCANKQPEINRSQSVRDKFDALYAINKNIPTPVITYVRSRRGLVWDLSKPDFR